MLNKITFFVKSYITFCWAYFIFVLTTAPMPLPYEYKFTLYDKIGHFILFGLFSFLVFYTLKDIKKIKKTWLYLISFLLGFFYSALAEWLQADLPTRTASELDFLAGLIGVTVFLFLAYLLYGGKK